MGDRTNKVARRVDIASRLAIASRVASRSYSGTRSGGTTIIMQKEADGSALLSFHGDSKHHDIFGYAVDRFAALTSGEADLFSADAVVFSGAEESEDAERLFDGVYEQVRSANSIQSKRGKEFSPVSSIRVRRDVGLRVLKIGGKNGEV